MDVQPALFKVRAVGYTPAMATVKIQNPLDQPTNQGRLLESLRTMLMSPDLSDWWLVVAFAKVGPLLRLQPQIEAWTGAGKRIHALFGIDERGTTVEALRFAMQRFTSAHVLHIPGPFTPTFHPKIYAFKGATRAVAFIGSNNLTVGGLETNFESHVRIEMLLPADQATWSQSVDCYQRLLPHAVPVTDAIIQQLAASSLILGEAAMRSLRPAVASAAGQPTRPAPPRFPVIAVVPQSAIPAPPRPRRVAGPKARTTTAPLPGGQPTALAVAAQALAIQIVPHHNGEIFLSKMAVEQAPAFFGWPFTGQTTPKRARNTGYPQRDPDPIVDIRLFDVQDLVVDQLLGYSLNTIYYSKKAEIRITVSPGFAAKVPAGAVMVMRLADTIDYAMDIYVPDSPLYQQYLAVCNQTMPSGGATNARRFGWI